MKKILIIGFVIMFILTGCTVDMFDNVSYGNMESKYQFKDYEGFLDVKEELEKDKDYFVIDTYETMKLKDVKSIDVGVIFENVIIVRENRDDVKIHYFGGFSTKSKNDEPEYVIDTKSTFKYHVNWKKLNGPAHAMMVVSVPKDYDGDFKADTVSADIEADTLTLGDVVLDTVSGDVNVQKMDAKTLSCDSVSGDVNLSEVELSDYWSNTVSGDVTIEELSAEDINFDSVSGEINIVLDGLRGDVKMDTVSGDIVITIKDSLDATLDIDSVSGDIDVDYDLKHVEILKSHRLIAEVGSGKYDIEIETISGDINIK